MAHPHNKHSLSQVLITRKAITIIVSFVAFFAIRQWLPISDLPEGHDPESIRTGLAILAMAAILWLTESLPLAITAILIPVAASLTNALDVTQSFAGFVHPLIFLFLGGFGLAAALSHQKLDQWLALHILKIGHGSFHYPAIAIFLVAALLSMWISNAAPVALLLPVALGILQHIEDNCEGRYKKEMRRLFTPWDCILGQHRRLRHTHRHTSKYNRIQSSISGWPPLLFIGVIVLIVIFLTEISTNTASTALLVPIFAAVAIDLGLPPREIILLLTLAASCAFMLPIATHPNAIVLSSGQIQQRDMVRIGFALNISFAVILTLLSQPLF